MTRGSGSNSGGDHPVQNPDEVVSFASLARPAVDRLIALSARCYDPRGSYSYLFHSNDTVDIDRAKAICARCAVRPSCLARALERREPCGVWGGQILHDGKIVARHPRRGRRPRSIVQLMVDEVTGEERGPSSDTGSAS